VDPVRSRPCLVRGTSPIGTAAERVTRPGEFAWPETEGGERDFLAPGWGKMKAALSARQDKNPAIAWRTSALTIANLDEAVKRAKAYEVAGVAAIFLAGGVTVEAVEVVSSVRLNQRSPSRQSTFGRRDRGPRVSNLAPSSEDSETNSVARAFRLPPPTAPGDASLIATLRRHDQERSGL
jgi:hypothetical protein